MRNDNSSRFVSISFFLQTEYFTVLMLLFPLDYVCFRLDQHGLLIRNVNTGKWFYYFVNPPLKWCNAFLGSLILQNDTATFLPCFLWTGTENIWPYSESQSILRFLCICVHVQCAWHKFRHQNSAPSHLCKVYFGLDTATLERLLFVHTAGFKQNSV